MEEIKYLPPLRGAVLWCVGLRRGAVPIETLAVIAEVDMTRARAFASILIARGALKQSPEGLVEGPAWSEWSGGASRSRPRSSGCEDSGMCQMRRLLRENIMRLAAERQWTAHKLAMRAGLPHQYIQRLFRKGVPLPACALLMVARSLEVTAEQLAAQDAELARN